MYSRVALAMVAFAANSVLCRLALNQQHIDPVSFSALRIAGGALMLGLMLLCSRPRHSPEFSWVNASLLSAYVFAFSVAYVAIDTGTGALLLFGTVQLIMSAWGLYKGEKMTVLKATGVAMAVAGIGILLLPSAAAPSPSAALLMAISGAAWAAYCITGKKVRHATAATAGNFLMAAPLAALFMLLNRHDVHADSAGVLLAITSGAITSALAYVLWYSLLPRLSSTMASAVQLSVPCLAVLGGVLFMEETLDLHIVVSTVIILGGIGLIGSAEKSRRP
jgi:drug/metabolite transporter (DMT)-like permease